MCDKYLKMKISAEQKATLVEILRDKPKLINGKFDSTFTHATAKAEWEAIATLNSMPGCQKTWQMWRSTWQHIRSRTKQKQALRNRRATGGGPEDEVLGDTDETILSIIKPVMVEGHVVAEPSIKGILPGRSCSPENINHDDPVVQQPEGNSRPTRKILQRPYLKAKKSGEAIDAYKKSLDKKIL